MLFGDKTRNVYQNTCLEPMNPLKFQYLSCERCLRSSYFHDVILEFLTHNYRYLCEKKTSVRKLIVIFKAFWTCSSMVSIKITCYYIFMLKNRNKHVKNTNKSYFFALFSVEIWKLSKLNSTVRYNF